MHFLITNDDGIQAPALRKLAEILLAYGKVTCVAPADQQSGVSQKFTFLSPLKVERHEDWPCPCYSVEGTPADCVKLGLHELVDEPVDMVVSGVNHGLNLGVAVLYSGTVAAAREAILWEVPALALSAEVSNEATMKKVDLWFQKLFAAKFFKGMAKNSCWNVNFPSLDFSGAWETRVCQMGESMYVDRYRQEGKNTWVLEGTKDPSGFEPESDDYWWEQGNVTLVPLQVSQTSQREYENLRNIAENF